MCRGTVLHVHKDGGTATRQPPAKSVTIGDVAEVAAVELEHVERLERSAAKAADAESDEAGGGVGATGADGDAVDVALGEEGLLDEGSIAGAEEELGGGGEVVAEDNVVATVAVNVGDAWAAPFELGAGLIEADGSSDVGKGEGLGLGGGWEGEEKEEEGEIEEGWRVGCDECEAGWHD